jgi:DNA-binding LacI/PurR family transcriptional regulator
MEDVAREAGVSRALVSLVMRGSPSVSDARRTAVLDAAARLGYRPNLMARNLAQRRTATIGVLINDLHNPFFAEIVDGVEQAASAEGYLLLLSTAFRRARLEKAMMDVLVQHRMDGVILLSPRVDRAALDAVARTTPTVIVGKLTRGVPADCIMTDETHGAALVVDHLVSLGRRRIVHVDGGTGAGAAQRRTGYLRAMARHGLGKSAEVLAGDFTESAGMRAAGQLLRRRRLPGAVFAANDLSAAGVLDTLEEGGVRVPADVSVVGYDNTFLAALSHMSLTTVNQPRAEMGRLAVKLLLRRIADPSVEPVVELVVPELVVRRTSGPIGEP